MNVRSLSFYLFWEACKYLLHGKLSLHEERLACSPTPLITPHTTSPFYQKKSHPPNWSYVISCMPLLCTHVLGLCKPPCIRYFCMNGGKPLHLLLWSCISFWPLSIIPKTTRSKPKWTWSSSYDHFWTFPKILVGVHQMPPNLRNHLSTSKPNHWKFSGFLKNWKVHSGILSNTLQAGLVSWSFCLA